MSTATRPMSSTPRVVSKRPEPTVRELIEAARAVPARPPARGAWIASGLTGVLLWASFMPVDWGPLGWVALVPLVLLIRPTVPARWLYRTIYACGFLSILATLQWMRLGHPTMYAAWIALSAYMAVYWVVFAAVSRAAVHRLGIPLCLAVPVVWVGLEFVRAHLMTGFAWYFLGHTQYRWIELIQISDLTGAYGVSFLLALTSGCLAGLAPSSLLSKLALLPADAPGQPTANAGTLKRQVAGAVVCLTLFAAVLGYGYVRRSQARFAEGPRMALVQGNFTTSVKHDPQQYQDIFNRHYWLTGQAVVHQPDVIVWPESMYRTPLLVASPEMTRDELKQLAPRVPPDAWREAQVSQALASLSKQSGAGLIIGVETLEATPAGLNRYNSAAFMRPSAGLTARYDKLHRVVFGEYIPLKETLPWLHKMTPFPEDFGLTAGRQMSTFEYRDWRFVPLICFEDTVPHLVRRMIAASHAGGDKEGGAACLVNLTNDGWFHGSSELDQHLITSVFRSVECRVPMVRAVNTGISAVIDGDGVVVEPDVVIDDDLPGRDSMRDPRTGRWYKRRNVVLVDDVPLDNRTSLYVVAGDWFASACLFFTLVFAAGPLLRHRSRQREEASSSSGS